jgi:hypothetical protein
MVLEVVVALEVFPLEAIVRATAGPTLLQKDQVAFELKKAVLHPLDKKIYATAPADSR